jgi:hypothetical protein
MSRVKKRNVMKKSSVVNGRRLVFPIACLLLSCLNPGDKIGSQATPGTIQAPSAIDSASNTPSVTGANLDAASDVASDGGTITFQNIGSAGWYPSRRDPATGPCDAYSNGSCCQAKHVITGDSLTPWNEELIMTLRGPMIVLQIAVYQPNPANANVWDLVSLWDDKSPTVVQGIAFKGNGTEASGFQGIIGNTCLVDVSTNKKFSTGPGSMPYCPLSSDTKYYGWEGSKMVIVQARMPFVASGAIDDAKNCGTDTTNNWYNAPWIGLSHGEMVRSGAFGTCHCYAKDAVKWYLADGCGQFNAFEVVNDNNSYQNFDLFSTNFFGYGGYVGEGPCGKSCTVSGLNLKADLVDKSTSMEAVTGAISTPTKGPGAAFRRPAAGYRFFVMLFDVKTRTVQLALIHPANVPATVGAVLPGLPPQIQRATIDNMLALRLPGRSSVGVITR